MSDLDLLRIQLASALRFDELGRIASKNDPDRSEAPLAVFASCSDGNLCAFSKDVTTTRAADMRKIFSAEEPIDLATSLPLHLERYVDLLGVPHVSIAPGLIYALPHRLGFASDAAILTSDSAEGRRRLMEFARNGMPAALVALGFNDAGELWPPWCAALLGDEVVALAFAARLGERGADIGVITVPAFRGRGFAAAVSAAWTFLPELKNHTLFYSTSQANRSSQQVAARLGLRLFGATCVLTRKPENTSRTTR